MSAPGPVLSREELTAILAEPELQSGPLRPSPEARRRPLARALTGFAEEQARLTSTIHQRPIDFELLRCVSMPVGEFAATLLDEDRAFLLKFGAGYGAGVLVIGRGLLFGWLSMAFGAPEILEVPVPERTYTRIEARFMQRLAVDLVQHLAKSLGTLAPSSFEIGECVDPVMLPERSAPRLIAASFEVRGIGEPGRLRVGFPDSWVDGAERATEVPRDGGQIGAERLFDMPLWLHAEVGGADLSLRKLASLRPGDVIPIEGHAGGAILVRIEDAPKFKAERGSAGAQAAIQIVSRV